MKYFLPAVLSSICLFVVLFLMLNNVYIFSDKGLDKSISDLSVNLNKIKNEGEFQKKHDKFFQEYKAAFEAFYSKLYPLHRDIIENRYRTLSTLSVDLSNTTKYLLDYNTNTNAVKQVLSRMKNIVRNSSLDNTDKIRLYEKINAVNASLKNIDKAAKDIRSRQKSIKNKVLLASASKTLKNLKGEIIVQKENSWLGLALSVFFTLLLVGFFTSSFIVIRRRYARFAGDIGRLSVNVLDGAEPEVFARHAGKLSSRMEAEAYSQVYELLIKFNERFSFLSDALYETQIGFSIYEDENNKVLSSTFMKEHEIDPDSYLGKGNHILEKDDRMLYIFGADRFVLCMDSTHVFDKGMEAYLNDFDKKLHELISFIKVYKPEYQSEHPKFMEIYSLFADSRKQILALEEKKHGLQRELARYRDMEESFEKLKREKSEQFEKYTSILSNAEHILEYYEGVTENSSHLLNKSKRAIEQFGDFYPELQSFSLRLEKGFGEIEKSLITMEKKLQAASMSFAVLCSMQRDVADSESFFDLNAADLRLIYNEFSGLKKELQQLVVLAGQVGRVLSGTNTQLSESMQGIGELSESQFEVIKKAEDEFSGVLTQLKEFQSGF